MPTPPKSAADVLSEVSGLPKAEINGIWEKVKANAKVLAECKRPHEFPPLPEKYNHADPNARKRTCLKCGGVMDWVNASYYLQGLADARAERNSAPT